MSTQRQLRANNLLQHEVADIIRREVDDPRVGFVTITGADVAPDMSTARVFVSVLGDAEAKRETLRALIRARKFIRSHISERLELRRTPRLSFHLDETAERAQRMEEALRGLDQEGGDRDESDQ